LSWRYSEARLGCPLLNIRLGVTAACTVQILEASIDDDDNECIQMVQADALENALGGMHILLRVKPHLA
jgi:hypothetical protein